jgi:predicted dienelactone hydrolase
VKRAIDFAEALTLSTSAFLGLIDTKRTAVAGHSDGAFTSLLVGGARINMVAASALCASSGPHTVECSGWISELGRSLFAQSTGRPKEPAEGLYPSYGDPRVKALLPMAADGEMEATLDLSAVTMPTLLMIGSSDRYAPLWGTERIYQNLTAPQKAKVVIVNAGHALYCITKNDVAVSADTAGLDSGLCDPKRTHAVINHFTAAFLLDVLKGDQEAHKALLPETVKFEEVQYTTTWK